jgi:predicted RNase H-like HicB family nuclease
MKMNQTFTAVIKKNEKWWIGWVEEIPGVNSQGRTRQELIENLKSALREALEFNRNEARSAAVGEFEEESILV